MKNFDYIFAGGGLAALLMVNEMIISGQFKNKSILIIDSELKNKNDRTWCFWEKNNDDFKTILFKTWHKAFFANNISKKNFKLAPYQYNMIRSASFYEQIKNKISQINTITIVQESVENIQENNTFAKVITKHNVYSANMVFSSIFNPENLLNQTKYPLLQQHFIGWFIKTETPIFNPYEVGFMDFSIPQKGNTRFMYVLPTSTTEALIEYTLFSKDLLEKKDYENAIIDYIKNLGISKYTITETEKGNIPMTCYPFWENNSKHIHFIGSAGGWTKASTGYTFKKSTKKAKILVNQLINQKSLKNVNKKDKFWFYDLLFIDVLYKNNELGKSLFSSLFLKRNPKLVFKFLDEETTFMEDLNFIWRCPKLPFIKALFSRIF